MWREDKFVLGGDESKGRLCIVLGEGAETMDAIWAWWQAFCTALAKSRIVDVAESAGKKAKLEEDLRAAGWDVDIGALETCSGYRYREEVVDTEEKVR